MSVWTLFAYPFHQAYKDDAYIGAYSKDAVIVPPAGCKQNVLWKKSEEIALDNTQTRTLNIHNLVTANATLGEWCYILVRCIGAARINTTGTDTDGSTVIHAKIPFFGTLLYPDMGIISTVSVNAMVLESLQDSTVVEFFAAICCQDDDARLTTFA